MKIGRKMLCLTAVLVAVCLVSAGAAAENPADFGIEEKGLTLGESALTYPAVTGLPEELNQAVNDRILADTGVPDYLIRISQLMSGGSLTVSWIGGILGDVFSCAVSAEGAVETLRPAHVWTWSNIDLRDGHEIALEELFADPEAARKEIERYLEDEVAPELSAHLGSSELLPIPEGFMLERTGLILFYPANQLSTLSDRAGAVKIGWHWLAEELDLSEDGIPARSGVPEMISLTEDSRAALTEMMDSGSLTDVPASIGDPLQALTDEYHLLMDPEVYEGGRLFALEGSAFQNVLLLTDFLSESWENSVVQGFRATDGCYRGLCIGVTRQDDWEAVLGEPDSRVELDPETAEYMRVEPGICDYYRFGAYQLQLYADTEGVLRCLALTE